MIFSVASCGVHRIFLGEGGGKWGPKGDFKYEKKGNMEKGSKFVPKKGENMFVEGREI